MSRATLPGRLDEIGLDPQPCEELFCAVIGLAIRDLEQIDLLEGKSDLTIYEAKKLLRLTAEWHPAVFLASGWFEEICVMLNVHPEVIRAGLRAQKIGDRES